MDLFLRIVLPPGGRVIGVEKSRKFASLALAACQVKIIYACLLVTLIVVYMQEAGLADLVEIRVGEARTVLESMQGTSLKLNTLILDR
jgi:hypothetical protein